MLAISSDSLRKTYRAGFLSKRHVEALRDVSLTVNTGEIFGLLGPNGAGKTTFIKILLSLTHATSGQAAILGTQLPNVKIRERIGYLPENHRFPDHMTGDQVMWLFGQLNGVPRADIRSRVEPLLKLVGMDQWRSVKVRRYSKGMMQRLGLAHAMINDPDLLFLDEPTDGIDPVGRKEIRDILKSLRDRGKTIFLNSHLLSEVELVSDRVAILDKGRLLKTGTVDELTASRIEYIVGLHGSITEAVKDEIAARRMKVSSHNDQLSAELETVAELNALIDILRRDGIAITSIVKKRNTLEDSFLSLLKRETTP